MPHPSGAPGLQLYTVRRALDADFERTLEAVAAIGYATVELAGLHGRTAAAFRAALDGVGLAATSGHVQFDALGEAWPWHLEAAALLGQAYVVCAAAPRHAFRSPEAVRELADVLSRAGEVARRAGVRFAYHNHDFEFAPVGGAVPYDLLLERSDPRVVDFEVDLGWVRAAGCDASVYFDRHPGRFRLLHVGDVPPRAVGEAADPEGEGLRRALARARGVGVHHVFVEHDEAPEPALESAARSYRHLRAAGW